MIIVIMATSDDTFPSQTSTDLRLCLRSLLCLFPTQRNGGFCFRSAESFPDRCSVRVVQNLVHVGGSKGHVSLVAGQTQT
jgi:hypothetical protein